MTKKVKEKKSKTIKEFVKSTSVEEDSPEHRPNKPPGK